VPSMNRKINQTSIIHQYCYGKSIFLGSMTDFSLFLGQVQKGNIYYDPGIKLEFAIEGQRKQQVKRRSQFRIKSSNLSFLYKKNEIKNLINE